MKQTRGGKIENQRPIKIFFIGIGDDAEMEVDQMLAEGIGTEFRGLLGIIWLVVWRR